MPHTHTLLNQHDYEFIKNRILSLNTTHQAQWGKMKLPQMLKHVYTTLQISLGDIEAPRPNFLIRLLGVMYKKKYTKDNKIFDKFSPTSSVLIITNSDEFEAEKKILLEVFEKFHKKLLANQLLQYHPFFQTMNQEEWGILQFKHIDHHLRQFGV